MLDPVSLPVASTPSAGSELAGVGTASKLCESPMAPRACSGVLVTVPLADLQLTGHPFFTPWDPVQADVYFTVAGQQAEVDSVGAVCTRKSLVATGLKESVHLSDLNGIDNGFALDVPTLVLHSFGDLSVSIALSRMPTQVWSSSSRYPRLRTHVNGTGAPTCGNPLSSIGCIAYSFREVSAAARNKAQGQR